MPKYTKLENHLSLSELEVRYRKAQDPVARSQWQIIWLLAQSKKVVEVVEVTGYSPGWVRTLARRYNAVGASALGDQRHHAKGQPPLLSASHQAELKTALQDPHPDKGLWNGPKVAEWIKLKTGRTVRRQRGWEYLDKLGFTQQVPRPHHTRADKEAQSEFKKT